MITKYIGQKPTVESMNEILQAAKNEIKAGREYAFRPINLGGWTGTGKSNLAECFAEQVQDLGFNYIQITPNAGWRDLYAAFAKVKSEDEKGRISPIPYVIFWDEFHSQKIGLDIMKALTTKVEESHVITRQGFNFPYFPTAHCHIFASNFSLDQAMKRRCRNFTLTTYTPSEMHALAELMLCRRHGLTLGGEALEALLSRTKPLAGDLEEVCAPLVNRAKAEGIKKLSAQTVTEVLKRQGFFPQGLRREDMIILTELKTGSKPVNILKFKVQDEKKKATQERVDWLCSIGLSEPARNGYCLSKVGVEYLRKIADAQKAAKGKK